MADDKVKIESLEKEIASLHASFQVRAAQRSNATSPPLHNSGMRAQKGLYPLAVSAHIQWMFARRSIHAHALTSHS